MTRMERRRRRQRQIRRRVACAVVVAAIITAAVTAVLANSQEPEEVIEPVAPVVTARAETLALRTETPELVLEGEPEEGPLIPEDPQETEKIEQALLEQGYFNEEIPLDFDLQDHLRTACTEFGVPYHIALGVIQAESSFRADASNGTCFGFMQINKINADWLAEEIGVTDLLDPFQNLRAGVYILSGLYADYGDWHKTLIAYNYGRAGAQKHVFSQGYTTTGYSRTVMAYAEEWLEVVGE